MKKQKIFFFLILISFVFSQQEMPAPFSRVLSLQTPQLQGNDVLILQTLSVRKNAYIIDGPLDGIFGTITEQWVKGFQKYVNITQTGIFDVNTANLLLQYCSYDGYKDDWIPVRQKNLKYKIHIPVTSNRSEEQNATLYDQDNNPIFTFRTRLHGHNYYNENSSWPNYSSDGNTPTGEMLLDLNSPEDDPTLYGPYPINRVVRGIAGNAGLLLNNIRSGILLHTGEWPGWNTSQNMPNSAGCIHGHPQDINQLQQILQNKLGVEVHQNTIPKGNNYPFDPQGLLVIEEIQEQKIQFKKE